MGKFFDCDRAKGFMIKQACRSGLFCRTRQGGGHDDRHDPDRGWDRRRSSHARNGPQWRRRQDQVNWFMAELILVIMVMYVTMVYGLIAAFLVELFLTRSGTPRCRCRITW
jgi:hypothetical protein